MKTLPLSLLFMAPLLVNADENKYSVAQKAVVRVSSSICHPEYLSHNYSSMKIKVSTQSSNYMAFNSLQKCVLEGNRLRKVDEKHFPELVFLQSEILLNNSRDELEKLLKDSSTTDSQIKNAKAKISALESLNAGTKEMVKATEVKAAKEKEDINSFYGFNWAPGIALLNYSESYVSDLRIENSGEGDEQINTIYIDKEVDSNIAVMLETHFLVKTDDNLFGRTWGHGPFMATNVYKKENDPLTILSLGWMVSLKNNDDSNGISLGLGYFIDTEFQVTRDNLVDGDVTIYSDPTKAVRQVDEKGWMLILSATF
ncbi:hypothetical protein P4S67_18375 [Pseudoalteromonas sp. B137]